MGLFIRLGILIAALIPVPPHANFLLIRVTSKSPSTVRAIWRPYAGAIGARADAQQAALSRRWAYRANADSMRRWQDSSVRDTITAQTPTEFIVDMTGGPIVVEACGVDSIRVEAQLTPLRGPSASTWGRAIVVSSDGIEPKVVRRQ
jgi:hypothetical protein